MGDYIMINFYIFKDKEDIFKTFRDLKAKTKNKLTL